MLECNKSLKLSGDRARLALCLTLGLSVAAAETVAQDSSTTVDPNKTSSERLLLETLEEKKASTAGTKGSSETPSFEELDSAASDLNEALSGARAKLDELRQATELAAMAAELREELEQSIQENNRLAASLAEVQSERSVLESQQNASKREILGLQNSVDSSKIEIEEQKQRLDQRETQIVEIETARADAEAQIQNLKANLTKADSEISKLSGEIVDLNGKLEATRTELEGANDRAQQARTARDEADQELSKIRKQIAGMLRSVLLGGEPIDVSALEEAEEQDIEESVLGLSIRYEAVQASNVRAEPSPDSERIGFAKRGDFVTVIGKVNGRNWFEVETSDGIRGYIFGELIRPAA